MVLTDFVAYDPVPTVNGRDTVIFFIWSIIGIFLFIGSIYIARRHTDTVGFVLTPLVLLALTWENLALAISSTSYTPFHDKNDNALLPTNSASSMRINGVLALRGAVASFVIPLFLVCLFELNYTVHKHRSVNFFCIQFDQGHRRSTSFLSHLLRYSMWLLGLAILLLQIVVNSTYTATPFNAPLTSRFTFKGFAINHAHDNAFDWQDVTDFLPIIVLLLFSLYTGLSLWRYGTTMSTDIRSSSINPWCSIFFATLGLSLAYIFSPYTWPYPYVSNLAELGLALSLVITMNLVESNLRTLENWDKILQLAYATHLNTLARKQQTEIIISQAEEAAVEAAAEAAAAITARATKSSHSLRTASSVRSISSNSGSSNAINNLRPRTSFRPSSYINEGTSTGTNIKTESSTSAPNNNNNNNNSNNNINVLIPASTTVATGRIDTLNQIRRSLSNSSNFIRN